MFSILSFVFLLLAILFLFLGFLSLRATPKQETNLDSDNKLFERLNITEEARESNEHARVLGKNRGDIVDEDDYYEKPKKSRRKVTLAENDGEETDKLIRGKRKSKKSEEETERLRRETERLQREAEKRQRETDRLERKKKQKGSEDETDRLLRNDNRSYEEKTDRLNQQLQNEEKTDRLAQSSFSEQTDRLSYSIDSRKDSFSNFYVSEDDESTGRLETKVGQAAPARSYGEDKTDRLASSISMPTKESSDKTDRLSKPIIQQDKTDRLSKPIVEQDKTDRLSKPIIEQDKTDRLSKPIIQQDKTDRLSKPIIEQDKTDRLSKPIIEQDKTDRLSKPIIEQTISASDKTDRLTKPIIEQDKTDRLSEPIVKQEASKKKPEKKITQLPDSIYNEEETNQLIQALTRDNISEEKTSRLEKVPAKEQKKNEEPKPKKEKKETKKKPVIDNASITTKKSKAEKPVLTLSDTQDTLISLDAMVTPKAQTTTTSEKTEEPKKKKKKKKKELSLDDFSFDAQPIIDTQTETSSPQVFSLDEPEREENNYVPDSYDNILTLFEDY